MKIINTMWRICTLWISLSVFANLAQAQVAGIVGKQAVKQSAKTALKETAKQTAKKQVTKSVTKKITKKAFQESAERASKTVTFEVTQTAATKTAKELFERSALRTGKKKAAAKLTKAGGEEVIESAIKKTANQEVKKLAQEGGKKIAAKRAKKMTVSTMSEIAQKEELERRLNKRAVEVWEKHAAGKSSLNKLLLNDIAENPQLANLFSKNPQLLESYYNLSGSACRTDITMLRYVGGNADKARIMYYRPPKKRVWLSGNDLVYKDVQGQYGKRTMICHKQTGEILGYQTGNAKDGYYIELTKDNNPLTDLFLMPNTTYKGSNFSASTDRYGRVIRLQAYADKNVVKSSRDKAHIGRIREYKKDYDVFGNQKKRTGTYDDISGHLQPDSWGGESNFLNIIPQNNEMNAKGLWKNSEMAGLKAAKKGGEVVRDMKVEYPDRVSLRPSKIIVTQTVNGQIQKVNGRMMNNVVFENVLVKKAS